MKITYYTIFIILLLGATLFYSCSVQRDKSITVTNNKSSETMQDQIPEILNQLKEEKRIEKVDTLTSNESSTIELRCTIHPNILDFDIKNRISTFSLNYPKETSATFDLIFHVFDKKCIVEVENIKYDVYYLSRNLPMAGAPKSEVSRDKKLLKEKTSLQIEKILKSIQEQLSNVD